MFRYVKALSFLLIFIIFSHEPLALGGQSNAKRIQFEPLRDPDVAGNASTIESNNAQDAIEEVANNVATSASPGFTWGKSGNINNSYLLNDTVPCNKSGRMVPVTSGNVTTIFVAAEVTSNATIQIMRRDPGPIFTVIASTTLVAQRTKTDQLVALAPVVFDDEICVFISGSIKNPVVGLIIKGSL